MTYEWPKCPSLNLNDNQISEKSKNYFGTAPVVVLQILTKYSSFRKLQRVLALLRFIIRIIFKNDVTISRLFSVEELKNVHVLFVR